MGRTIGELFRDPNSYRYGTNYSEVKSDTETLIEQETTGIRIKSLVDVNNPLIYGNQATRIALRSTPDLEKMKEGANGGTAGGGLVGGAINKARDFVNDKLGIPSNQIPTKVSDKIIELRGNNSKTSADPVDNGFMGKNGTGLGALLKSTGGGNPTTIGKQALGKGIGLVKDKLRGALFGEPQTIGEAIGEEVQTKYTNTNKYTKVLEERRRYKQEGGKTEESEYKDKSPIPFGNQSIEKIDLRLVSPIYNIPRTENNGRFGKTEYAFEPKEKDKALVNKQRTSESEKLKDEIKNTYNIGRGKLGIEELSLADDYKLDENDAFVKIGEDVKKDLIPLWFRRKGSKKAIPFRAILTGLTETTSPSWSGQRFLGNPYQFYLYEGVERSITLSIKVVSENPLALQSNWERLKRLTTYTYPTINNGLSNPPIIEFRLGSMYNNRVSFIESLQYTIPDEGVWETNNELGYLPKFIDVSMTIKFIEQDGAEDRVYDFDISKAAADAINEKRESSQFSTEPTTGDGQSNGESTSTKITTTKKSDSKELNIPDIPKSIGNNKNPNVGSTDSSPEDAADKGSQSAASDKLDGKTPSQAIKDTPDNVLEAQKANYKTFTQLYGFKRLPESDKRLQGEKAFAIDGGANMIGLEGTPFYAGGEKRFVVIFDDGSVREYRNTDENSTGDMV
tara:strand:+ start:3611 stop:5644 length:2034 start_codon:yes stop_codon:yes gene_type:complete